MNCNCSTDIEAKLLHRFKGEVRPVALALSVRTNP